MRAVTAFQHPDSFEDELPCVLIRDRDYRLMLAVVRAADTCSSSGYSTEHYMKLWESLAAFNARPKGKKP